MTLTCRLLAALTACLFAITAQAQQSIDLLIVNGQIVTMDAGRQVIDGGVIAVSGADIIAVGGAELAAQYSAARTIDARGGIVMPGMINLHNHIPMVAFRGLGEYAVEDRLFQFFFPLEKALLSRELIHIASRHAAMELALGGVTLVTDMYYHEDEVARAVREVGIRGVLGQTIIGFPVVDAPEPFGGLDYARTFIAEFSDDPLITPAIAPHAPYTVDRETLLKARALSDETGAPLVMHLAEFAHERTLVKARHPDYSTDESIIAYLDRIGFLGPNLLAAHVSFVSDADMDLLKSRGVGIAHNPKANSKGISGLSPAWEMYGKGLRLGLGTDGPMSSNQMDILNVMTYAASVARLRKDDPKLFTPFELVDMATMGGARALNREDELGSLEVGKRADIVILDTAAPNMQPNYDPYATIAFAAYPKDVSHTIVHGRVIVADGALLTVDRAAHDAEWQAIMRDVAAFAKTLGDGQRPLADD